jgi:hypothetical protein
MRNFLQKPLVLTLVMIVTFTWFSYLWWQDQQEQRLTSLTPQAHTASALPDARSLPTPPANPGAASAAAVEAIQ